MVTSTPTRFAASRHGFTSEESIGILTVIAMLTAIAAASYARNYFVGQIYKVKQAVIREHCKVVSQAVNSYRQDKGHAPASLDELIPSGYLVALPRGFQQEDCTW